jgi:hypothetical protein
MDIRDPMEYPQLSAEIGFLLRGWTLQEVLIGHPEEVSKPL